MTSYSLKIVTTQNRVSVSSHLLLFFSCFSFSKNKIYNTGIRAFPLVNEGPVIIVIEIHTSQVILTFTSDLLKTSTHKQARYTEQLGNQNEIQVKQAKNDGKITKLTRFVWRLRRLKNIDNGN